MLSLLLQKIFSKAIIKKKPLKKCPILNHILNVFLSTVYELSLINMEKNSHYFSVSESNLKETFQYLHLKLVKSIINLTFSSIT